MGKKILITGSNGLLGRSLRSCLLQHNFVVISTGLGSDRCKEFGGFYEEMDVTSLNSCSRIIDKYKPDIIINAAALTNVDACENNKEHCLNINTHSLLNYIPQIQKYNIHFIQLSTDFVFSGIEGSYVENDLCDPVNYYGFSKLESEKILLNTLSNFTIIRTSLVYSNDCANMNFLNWVKSSLEKKIKLKIVDDQYRTPTFLTDLVQAILKVLNMKKYGVYHISSGERLSIYQIVCNIAKYYGYNMRLINKTNSKTLNQAATRPKDSSLRIDKAVNELNFKPTSLLNSLK